MAPAVLQREPEGCNETGRHRHRVVERGVERLAELESQLAGPTVACIRRVELDARREVVRQILIDEALGARTEHTPDEAERAGHVDLAAHAILEAERAGHRDVRLALVLHAKAA